MAIPRTPAGWPYLADSNKLTEIDDYAQALAAALEGFKPSTATPPGDTGWLDLITASPFVAWTANRPQGRRIGSVVYFRGGWEATNFVMNGDNAVVNQTLPAALRPERSQYCPCSAVSVNRAPATAVFTAVGSVVIRPTTGSGFTAASWFTLDGLAMPAAG